MLEDEKMTERSMPLPAHWNSQVVREKEVTITDEDN